MTSTIAGTQPATSRSALSGVPFTSVKILDRFWSERIRINREETIPAGYEQCRSTGRIDAMRLDWRPGREPVPHIFWDSDVAKWLEAAAYSLATHPDAALEAQVDEVVALLAASQQTDGYINSYFSAVEPEKRWSNLRDNHELYCAGHLIEAAVAHFQATGKRTFLDIMRRYADCIASEFGVDAGMKPGYCGHEEIELALVKLGRVTGEKRYMDLARYFVDQRGRQPHYFDTESIARGEDAGEYNYAYNQSHCPVREQDKIVGHAVRAAYLYCAMADLAAEDGDEALKLACERIWNDLVETKMYVTGGIGSSRHNEGFTTDYDLPNETAYAETCAAIGLVFWAYRMLHIDGDSRYADVMERALYNGVISGVSLDGRKFFYENPLASRGAHHRQPWFGCACCPPNITRILASLGGYIYATGESRLAVHLYVASEAAAQVGEHAVTVRQETDYPWDGAVKLTLGLKGKARFDLTLRQPDWAGHASLRVNGAEVEPRVDRGYLAIDREWSDGDVIELGIEMPVRRVYADPRVAADCGRVALQRGPIVFCLEAADNGPELERLSAPRHAEWNARFDPTVLGGVITLKGDGAKLDTADGHGPLYRDRPIATKTVALTAVPYYTWDNRAAGEMLVWIRES